MVKNGTFLKNMPSINMEDNVAPLTPVEDPGDPGDPKLRSPKRACSTITEKISAKLSRNSSKIKTSASSPSLKKAPLATGDDLDPEDTVKVIHRRPRSLNQRRCHSEVTPEKTAELLVRHRDVQIFKEIIVKLSRSSSLFTISVMF